MKNSLYIHIPFCRQKCAYCDFYSVAYQTDLANNYVDILCQQISKLEGKFSTIYLGGGTPSVLEITSLAKLLKALKGYFINQTEFTVEVNPESVSEDKLKLCLDYGVNRLSIGIQSFNLDKLKKLGRIHSVNQAKESVLLAKKIGFLNIGIDLIFGVEDEPLSVWQKDLETAVSLPITHLSTYELTYEKATFLYRCKEEGKVKPLNEELVVNMYELAMDYLSKYSFNHYEISNFAKEGYQSRHNLNYWENNPYIGLGAGAVSYINNQRFKNISNVKKHIVRSGLSRPNQNLIESVEQLSPIERAKETAVLGMRCAQGINFANFYEKTGYNFMSLETTVISKLIQQGLIEYVINNQGENIGVKLTRKGFLFSDTVSGALL